MLRLLLVLLWLFPLVVPGVPAESTNDNSIISIDVSGHGALTPNNGPGGTTLQGNLLSPFSFSVNAGIASDYIDRGTTLSAHNPAGGAAFEAAFGLLYAGATITSVKLPTNPAAEVTFGGGIRPKVWNIEFDFGWTYLLYPGETLGGPTNGTNYWETFARADYKISDMIGIAGGLAYSPSISNTGAWSKYAAFGMSLTLPQNLLPNDVSAKLSGGVGYSWFGNQSPALGGYPLPAYTHWNVGATFSREPFNVDLRYSNTNLSRERCYVFTGDPGAVPGGRINPLTNPDGLLSNWCGPALVAKLWFSF
jgi:uncharacterized protein (TIGR02001 family)